MAEMSEWTDLWNMVLRGINTNWLCQVHGERPSFESKSHLDTREFFDLQPATCSYSEPEELQDHLFRTNFGIVLSFMPSISKWSVLFWLSVQHFVLCSSGKLRLGWHFTLILLMWRKRWAPNNASRWQMGYNSAFKGLISNFLLLFKIRIILHCVTIRFVPHREQRVLSGRSISLWRLR